MKLKLKFGLSGKKQRLPLNYQYPVSAWIYSILSVADQEFTDILHNEGYKLDNGKTFKLFTFSRLQFPKNTWKVIPKTDRLSVWARNAWLTISFQLPEQMDKFVMGLFKNQNAFIGDKTSGVAMRVEGMEVLGDVEMGGCEDVEIGGCGNVEIGGCEDVEMGGCGDVEVRFKSKTGIVLGLQVEGEKNEQYVSPLHPDYKKVFLNSLIDKYRATGKDDINIEDLDFSVKEISPKTVMQTIKVGTDAETKVRAYNFVFELEGPKEVVEVGYNSGFGNMCSMGFGFCEVME